MAEARISQDWNHTASLLAMLANVNRDPKRRSRPFQVTDFHPLRAAKARQSRREGPRILKAVFVDRDAGAVQAILDRDTDGAEIEP